MNLEWQVVTSPYIITEFFLIVERYKICLAGGLRLSVADPGFCRGREGGGFGQTSANITCYCW